MTQGKRVIAVSDFVKQHIMTHYNVPEDQIVTIYRGADIRRFNSDRVASERVTKLMQSYQIPPEKPVITLVGRLTKIKGHAILLAALSRMRHKDITCLFVGSDQGRVDYVAELKEQIKTLAPQTSVLMVKSCSDMPALYLMSDIIVNASIVPESFGRTVTEAQAMGRIVVASAHGGACETIQDGKTGFLVPPENVDALAQCLDKVLDMSIDERQKIQIAGISSVRERFSVQSMCAQTIELYKKVSL
jgi:glycosyltransferase involved in cell wall biosynthesis